MKKSLKKMVAVVALATPLSSLSHPYIYAQEMTPSQLILNVQQETDFEAVEKIQSGEFSLNGLFSVSGVQQFSLKAEGTATGAFNLDKEAEDIQALSEAQGDFQLTFGYYDSEGNLVTQDEEPQNFNASMALVDKTLYTFDGTNYQTEDATQEINTFFTEIDKNYEKIQQEFVKIHDEITQGFDKTSTDFIDKYFTVLDNGETYKLNFNKDINLDELIKDVKDTQAYKELYNNLKETGEAPTINNTEIELEQATQLVDEAIGIFISLFKELSFSFHKDTYLIQDSNITLKLAMADVFEFLNRAEEITGVQFMDGNEKVMLAMAYGEMLINLDLSFELTNFNEDITIELPQEFLSLENFNLLEETTTAE